MSSHPKTSPKNDQPAKRDADGPRVPDAPNKGEVLRDYFSFHEIFARVLSTADHELEASNKYLFWSGLGAGAALGLTFLAKVVFTETAGEAEPGLVGNLLYPIGFLIIVLGRYQLFTENTLTPVVLVLTRLTSVANVLRLWLIVLVANMIGALGVAALLSVFEVMTPERVAKALEMGRHSHEQPWFDLFSKAIIAGWIVAAMVWMIHASQDTLSKIVLVFVSMYFIGVANLYHIITSSVEVFFLALRTPDISLLPLFPNFVVPVLLGNILGGVTFVAILNYALFAEHEDSEIFRRYGDRLSVKDWLLGRRESVEV